MSYKAEIEFSLHLHTFKNIQIDRQGYAALRIQLYDQSAPNINYALPYNFIPYHKGGLIGSANDPSIEDNAFHSTTVKIQYADEKYLLNDIVQFKLLLESVPLLESSKIYLKFTLLFASLNSYNQTLDPLYHTMQSITLKLENIQIGILHYYEAQFTQNYASSFSFALFSMITDFKLYPYSMRKQVIPASQQERKREKQREKISQLQDLLIWATKYIKNCQQPIPYFYNNFAKILRYNSYLLKTRFNECLKNKKQTQLRLPKFFKQSQNANSKQFYEFFSTFNPSALTLKLYLEQIRQLHEQNYFFAQQVCQSMSKGLIDYKKLENEYNNFRYSQSHGRLVKQIKFGQQTKSVSQGQQNIVIANKIRKQRKQQQPYPIMPSQQKVQQYLFYEVSYANQFMGKQIEKIKNQLPFIYDQRNMLIFLCHGFQASSYDMRIIQRGIKQALPLAEVVVSCANEGDTDGDIDLMGKKLAREVNIKIKSQGLKKQQVILNFVGHSMGGIIARAALKYLTDFQNQFGFYCSLSSPHLGYRSGTDGMIKAGLWVMRKVMKQSKSLDQLSMADSNVHQDTFLYNLSREGSLKIFKKVILISSGQDSYVPWNSARISLYQPKKNSKNIQNDMAISILGDLNVHRIDVNFACQKSDLDGFIGRKAHINLIINQSIFKLINSVIPNLFDLRSV